MSKQEIVAIPIARSRFQDLFITCMESGYTSWVSSAKLAPGPENDAARRVVRAGNKARKNDAGLVWYGHTGVFEEDLVIELRYTLEKDDEGTFRGKVHLRISDFVRGLVAMADAQHGAPHRLGDILVGEEDGPGSDCWLQCVVFGKVVYT